MRKVLKTEHGCWLWQGTTGGSNARYGYFRPGTKSSDPKVMAHRWLYEQMVGQIPDGYELDHVSARGCTSKLCVNPSHLEPVTHEENRKRGRLAVCRSGRHKLVNDESANWDGNGNRRGCKACHREAAAARYKRTREVRES